MLPEDGEYSGNRDDSGQEILSDSSVIKTIANNVSHELAAIQIPPLAELVNLPQAEQTSLLAPANAMLFQIPPQERVRWALNKLESEFMLSSSFGIRAAIMLHLVTQESPDIPVILTDTGYLFDETYRFIDELVKRLQLNLKVYSAEMTTAWQEARYGHPSTLDAAGLRDYHQRTKVEPMGRAIEELGIRTWLAGLRGDSSDSRTNLPILAIQSGCWKLLPIIDMDKRKVHAYMKEYDLPYHPLWEQGYLRVGDRFNSRPVGDDDENEAATRSFAECGLHIGENESGAGI